MEIQLRPDSFDRNLVDLAEAIQDGYDLARKANSDDADPEDVQELIDVLDRIHTEWDKHFRIDLGDLGRNIDRIEYGIRDLFKAVEELKR